MNRCTKGLHEMTEDNTYVDGKGRKHCRGCIRQRKRGYRDGKAVRRNLKAHHKAETFTKEPTEWDKALEAHPPVITWRRKNNGVWVKVKVIDPHTERVNRKVAS